MGKTWVFTLDGDGQVTSMTEYEGPAVYAPGALTIMSDDPALGEAPLSSLHPSYDEEGQLLGLSVDPEWAPPAPPVDPVQAGLAALEVVVAKNVPASTHDRRYLTDKEIGKTLIPWLKAHPAATVQEATDQVMPLILAELPGQPVIPPLYWEWTNPETSEVYPGGLAMSYLYEARERGYCPPETPLTWEALVALVVATPEELIASWLRSL